MSPLPGTRTIRGRVALWFTLAVALLLALFGAAGYAFLVRSASQSVDDTLDEAAAAVASALALEAGGRVAPQSWVPRVVREMRFRGMVVAVYDRATHAIVSGEPLPGFEPHLTAAPRDRVVHATDERADPPLRYVVMPTRVAGRDFIIGAAHSLGNQRRILSQYRLGLLAAIPLLLVLSAAGGWTLARKSLHPVAAMTGQAARIGASTLHERLPLGNPDDELGRLAAVLNDLLARLDQAFDRQRQFMADASHELRTPVAIISGEAEHALARDERPAAELREALATVRHEAKRLTRIVDDLFTLARAEAGEPLLVPTELYLDDVADACIRAVRSLAAARDVSLRMSAEESLAFHGDEALLKRLVMNLLDNAIKHTPAGGDVSLELRRTGRQYVLAVHDTGGGIPAEVQPRLFDRFFRQRQAHGHESGGAGLGLAIAKWIAEAHAGTLTLDATGPTGSTFTLRLPAPAEPPRA